MVERLDSRLGIFFKRTVLILVDVVFLNFAAYLSVGLRFDFNLSNVYVQSILARMPLVTIASILIFWLFSLYNSVWEFVSIYELMQVFFATVFAVGIGYLFDTLFNNLLPRTSYIIMWPLMMMFIGGSRFAYRGVRRILLELYSMRRDKKHVLIVGGGKMGTIMIKDLINNAYRYGKPVAVVDDAKEKQGKRVSGIMICGTCGDISEVVEKYQIDEILICLPSASVERQKEIINIAMKTGRSVKITPSVYEMTSSDFSFRKMRNVEISDLLSRPEVKLDPEICAYMKDQVILVTGGGGSIGSELCRQAARYNPKQIVIFDIYENNAYDLMNEMKELYRDSVDIRVIIGSVRDLSRLEQVFEEFSPSVVFHAAAHKHVPLMEDSPCEAVKNNVFGTYNAAVCADKYNVKKFVLLSTDKAVNPTNVMGATKRITELVIQYMSRHSRTCFAAVRFGNVLNSNGSVIPLFKRQIESGGPVTVTHRDITRYFMTIPEAAQLVVQAGGIAKGGEVFVLDMGQPVKITDLAENLIRLSGYTPHVDIKIEFTGLRPGEKLYEELSMSEENAFRVTTKNKKIFITKPVEMDDRKFMDALDDLHYIDNYNVRFKLKNLVPNYKENGEIVAFAKQEPQAASKSLGLHEQKAQSAAI